MNIVIIKRMGIKLLLSVDRLCQLKQDLWMTITLKGKRITVGKISLRKLEERKSRDGVENETQKSVIVKNS